MSRVQRGTFFVLKTLRQRKSSYRSPPQRRSFYSPCICVTMERAALESWDAAVWFAALYDDLGSFDDRKSQAGFALGRRIDRLGNLHMALRAPRSVLADLAVHCPSHSMRSHFCHTSTGAMLKQATAGNPGNPPIAELFF